MSSALSSGKFSEIIKRRLNCPNRDCSLDLLLKRRLSGYRQTSGLTGNIIVMSYGAATRTFRDFYGGTIAKRNFGESDVIFLGIYELSGCPTSKGSSFLCLLPSSISLLFPFRSPRDLLGEAKALPVSDVP